MWRGVGSISLKNFKLKSYTKFMDVPQSLHGREKEF